MKVCGFLENHVLMYCTSVLNGEGRRNREVGSLSTKKGMQIMFYLYPLRSGDVVYPSMPRLMKVSWVLSNIMGAMHLFVTLGYWIVVYPNRNG